MSKEKIFLITSRDLGTIGGTQISTGYLINPLGADTLLISPYQPPDKIKCRFLIVPTSQIMQPLLDIPQPNSIQNFRTRVKLEEPERLIFDHPNLYSSILFLSLPENLRGRSYAIWRSMLDTGSHYDINNKFMQIERSLMVNFLRRLQRIVGNRMGRNLAISHAVAKSLTRIGINHDKIDIIRQQVGEEISPEIRTKDDGHNREKYLKTDELGVLIVSRISPEKGLNWIPDVIKHLRTIRRFLHPDAPKKRIKICLVGGAQKTNNISYLENLLLNIKKSCQRTNDFYAADSVEFEYLGEKPSSAMQELYNAFDILLQPSPAEGFGRVSVEAMIAGMIVIGRGQCEATRDIVNEPPYSIGDLASSPEEAAELILQFTQDSLLLAQLQHNALLWGNGNYSLTDAISDLRVKLKLSEK